MKMIFIISWNMQHISLDPNKIINENEVNIEAISLDVENNLI